MVDYQKFIGKNVCAFLSLSFGEMHFRKRNGEPIVIDELRMNGGNVNGVGLKIEPVLRTDRGNYTCELQNEYGVGISDHAISLDVHCKCQKIPS